MIYTQEFNSASSVINSKFHSTGNHFVSQTRCFTMTLVAIATLSKVLVSLGESLKFLSLL